ncbi:hypothetical protein N5923_24420 [Erwiniaceae bacterium BAC15a-03b]|uniref:Hemolysin XhlA n=1 Tax=Winslowiella arboricola TaxID=2978220 RepID=A0A9J6Q0E8_9GAMM|nr:hypothetical protein [Winslowiella arboricola]MCU5772928.1 hypothetical protein [Winslowiella arboricola]MCU5780644.1 hypothetical protein [Winslowiella arboricola]
MHSEKQTKIAWGNCRFSGVNHKGGDNMQPRLEKLEYDVGKLQTDVEVLKTDVADLKIDVAVIKSNYATKADISAIRSEISEAKSQIIMWVMGAVFLAQFIPAIIKVFTS